MHIITVYTYSISDIHFSDFHLVSDPTVLYYNMIYSNINNNDQNYIYIYMCVCVCIIMCIYIYIYIYIYI